jgi:DNA (cytosine-5)-methyltransferase 1
MVTSDMLKARVPLFPAYQIPAFRFVDIFAGIGGMRLGFEAAGGQCVFSSEWDVHSQKTYFANHGDFPKGDITLIPSSEIPDFDVLLAGFPCQPFSSIGLRQGFLHQTQGTLFYEIARILADKKPLAFLLENVEGLVTHNSGQTMQIILETLRELGYVVTYQVLDASEFGVPQKRKRIYIVGHKLENTVFSFPKGTRSDVFIGQFIETGVEGYGISEHLQKTYIFKKDDGKPAIVSPDSRIHIKTQVASYHKIQRLTGTFVRDGKTGLRLLTENECKAIMGFPPHFVFPVSRTQMYRQIGNSVAVPVITAIAKEIQKQLIGKNMNKKQLPLSRVGTRPTPTKNPSPKIHIFHVGATLVVALFHIVKWSAQTMVQT